MAHKLSTTFVRALFAAVAVSVVPLLAQGPPGPAIGTDLSGDKCSKKTFSRNNDGSWGLLAECDMSASSDGSGAVTE